MFEEELEEEVGFEMNGECKCCYLTSYEVMSYVMEGDSMV